MTAVARRTGSKPRTVRKGDARRPKPIVLQLSAARHLFGGSRSINWLALVLLVLLGMLLVRPMANSALSYHRTAGLLEERRGEVASLQARNVHLQRQVAYYKTDVFLAERAREYGLVKPGERAYVIREYSHPDRAGQYAQARARRAISVGDFGSTG